MGMYRPCTPLWLWGCDFTPPYLRSIAVIYCGVAIQDRQKCLEGSLASSVHTGGHRLAEVLSAAAFNLASVAWI